jgi:hypothetical protein
MHRRTSLQLKGAGVLKEGGAVAEAARRLETARTQDKVRAGLSQRASADELKERGVLREAGPVQTAARQLRKARVSDRMNRTLGRERATAQELRDRNVLQTSGAASGALQQRAKRLERAQTQDKVRAGIAARGSAAQLQQKGILKPGVPPSSAAGLAPALSGIASRLARQMRADALEQQLGQQLRRPDGQDPRQAVVAAAAAAEEQRRQQQRRRRQQQRAEEEREGEGEGAKAAEAGAKRPSPTKGKKVSEMAAAFATGAAADEGASPPRSLDRAHHRAAAAAAAPKEVTLDRSSGLGLVLVEDDDSDGTTVVYDFVPLADGSEGPGFRCGRIGVGDSLVAVQGRPMAGIAHDGVLACIAAAPTLVTLAFQAPGGGGGGGDDAARTPPRGGGGGGGGGGGDAYLHASHGEDRDHAPGPPQSRHLGLVLGRLVLVRFGVHGAAHVQSNGQVRGVGHEPDLHRRAVHPGLRGGRR